MDEHPENDQGQQTKRSKDAWWKGTEAKQRKRQKKPRTKRISDEIRAAIEDRAVNHGLTMVEGYS